MLTIHMNDELSKNARGGTELMGEGLQKYVDADLLSKVHIIRSRVRHLDPIKPNILWLHDLPHDPESAHLADPLNRAKFAKLVYVSNWQKDQYQGVHGIRHSEGVVLQNAIDPIDILDIRSLKRTDDTIRLIYHPTPHRGLEILVPVFDALVQEFPNLHLDVFSSFQLYGWPERDLPYQTLFDACRDHPNITYHGSQPPEVVRRALARADIFAYPSIWQETSCICAMEAMSAQCAIVAPNLAALPETTAGFAMMYNMDEDPNRHARVFYDHLRRAIIDCIAARTDHERMDNWLGWQKAYADSMYGWNTRASQWNGLLQQLIIESMR